MSQPAVCRGCLDDCHNARVKLQAESVKSVPLDAHIKEVTESRLEAISASALAGLQVCKYSRATSHIACWPLPVQLPTQATGLLVMLQLALLTQAPPRCTRCRTAQQTRNLGHLCSIPI